MFISICKMLHSPGVAKPLHTQASCLQFYLHSIVNKTWDMDHICWVLTLLGTVMSHFIYSSWQSYKVGTIYYPHLTEQKTDSQTFGNMPRIAWLVRDKAGMQTYICVVLKSMALVITLYHFPSNTELPWTTLRRGIYEIFKGFLPSRSLHHIHLPIAPPIPSPNSSRLLPWGLSEPRKKNLFSNIFKSKIKVNSHLANYKFQLISLRNVLLNVLIKLSNMKELFFYFLCKIFTYLRFISELKWV